jgi:hypothetical protein
MVLRFTFSNFAAATAVMSSQNAKIILWAKTAVLQGFEFPDLGDFSQKP